MTEPNMQEHIVTPQQQAASAAQLQAPPRWHDPLRLIEAENPGMPGRVVLWSISTLTLLMVVWACLGKLDIIASAEGKLVTQTLVKVVQPAEAGVVKELLVAEGDVVKAGQVLARLDPTVALADSSSAADLLAQREMQLRRIEAALAGRPMRKLAADDGALFAQVQSQDLALRAALDDTLEQERALLAKAEGERKSALQVLSKLDETIPTYERAAQSFAELAKEGYVGALAAGDRQREALEKRKDRDAQAAAIVALNATIQAQQRKIAQVDSNYRAELQREAADINANIRQLRNEVQKTRFKASLTELRAPQDGIVKDLATTTIGAVVQPGAVVVTIVPRGEQLFADVAISNADIGFVRAGQEVQVKLAAYPFQEYGILKGRVVRISADASDRQETRPAAGEGGAARDAASYQARVLLDSQTLQAPNGKQLPLAAGMLAQAEIRLGERTVMQYLLSPVQRVVSEAAHEK
jgi:HlyD family secretion protein